MKEDPYGVDCEQVKQEAMRFAQCLRGHPALIVLLPVTWRYGAPHQHTGSSMTTGGWYDERGKRVKKDEVMARLESRIIDLYGFYPTEAEVAYIHDDLLVPLYSADALSRFLHTFLYPDPKASVQVGELLHRWRRWSHRTVEPEDSLLCRMRDRRLKIVDGVLLGWQWRRLTQRPGP